MYKFKKKITSDNCGVVFWDSINEEAVENVFVKKGTEGYLIDQGKTNGKRHITFWFYNKYMEGKSIEFFGWKHVKKFLEPINYSKHLN